MLILATLQWTFYYRLYSQPLWRLYLPYFHISVIWWYLWSSIANTKEWAVQIELNQIAHLQMCFPFNIKLIFYVLSKFPTSSISVCMKWLPVRIHSFQLISSTERICVYSASKRSTDIVWLQTSLLSLLVLYSMTFLLLWWMLSPEEQKN